VIYEPVRESELLRKELSAYLLIQIILWSCARVPLITRTSYREIMMYLSVLLCSRIESLPFLHFDNVLIFTIAISDRSQKFISLLACQDDRGNCQ
jgi:hypothetical protein